MKYSYLGWVHSHVCPLINQKVPTSGYEVPVETSMARGVALVIPFNRL